MARVGIERRPFRVADAALALWIAMLAAVTVYGAATTTGFLTVSNMKAILTAASFVGIIAVGLTVIVLSGNLFSLALGQTAAISAMVFLYTLRFGLVAAILLTLAARPRDRRGPGLRGRRLGRQPDHRHDRRRRTHGGHGRLALARPEHRPARRPDELGAPRESRPRPPCPRLRLHRRHGHPRGGDGAGRDSGARSTSSARTASPHGRRRCRSRSSRSAPSGSRPSTRRARES